MKVERFDIVVLGATPGGIAAALAASRLGHSVLLVEYHPNIGGMSASGLGKSDIEKRHLIGGLFAEFTERVRRHYEKRFGIGSSDFDLCRDGYYFEPSVAASIFAEMIGECPRVTLLRNHRLLSAEVEANLLKAIEVVDRLSGVVVPVAAGVFIDASYEGDLLAAAGAEFRLGRESRDEFGEAHAGRIYFDYQAGKILNGSTGEADLALPAYTYRLCLSTDPNNAAPLITEPANYQRANYLGYLDDLRAGRLDAPRQVKPGRGYEPRHFGTLMRALSVTPIPNGKTDVNINPRPLAFPFAEENVGYVEGDDQARQQICRRIQDLTLGLLYFLQNDSQVPESHRELATSYHLPADEFRDNAHFPFQLYVREARRLVGEYTLTENDVTRAVDGGGAEQHPDTIAVGEFPIDSFPCHKQQLGDDERGVLEGYLGMLDSITGTYEIPFRIMIPKSIDGLIVPVAASTTHVAFSSIRMEPTWMALGQAAGTAAHLSLTHQVPPRETPLNRLRQQLADDGQVLRADGSTNVSQAIAS